MPNALEIALLKDFLSDRARVGTSEGKILAHRVARRTLLEESQNLQVGARLATAIICDPRASG
jgi:hypothetical protein